MSNEVQVVIRMLQTSALYQYVNSETCYFSFFMSTIFPLFAGHDMEILIMKPQVQTIKMYDEVTLNTVFKVTPQWGQL